MIDRLERQLSSDARFNNGEISAVAVVCRSALNVC